MAKRLSAVSQSPTGRNTRFRDNYTGRAYTRDQLVRRIESGAYPHYHVRVVNGVKTPVSNPDRSTNNNLG